MASRQIVIRIVYDNREALNSAKAQAIAQQVLNNETNRGTHLQNSLTASFVKGNLAARAISVAYLTLRDSLKFAAGEAINFEHNMTKIGAITETSGASLRSMEKTIRSLAQSTNQSQNELAKAALEMGKMGLTGGQVEEALGGVARLARALDEDLVRTGETVVSVLNAYGFEANEAGKITDQLAFTVKASALSIESFGTAFSYVGGTAKAAGVDFTQLQGAMDVLSNAGIKASTIGTQLRRVIADLSNENSKASTAIGGQTIQSLGLVGALQALREKNIDIAGLTEIFGRTASSVSSILIRYADVVQYLADKTAAADGVTTSMSDQMNTTLKSNLQGITVAWADLGIEISKSTGFLSTFASTAKAALNAYSDGISQTQLLRQYQKEKPEEYTRVVRSNMMGSYFKGEARVATESPEFNAWKAQYFQREGDAKRKENIVSELQATFDKDFKLPANFNPSTQLDLIKVDAEQTYMFKYLQKLYGTDDTGFNDAVKRAKIEWALKAERAAGEAFDTDTLKKAKKAKPDIDFDPMDVFDRLEDLQPNGDTYAEAFMRNNRKQGLKQDKRDIREESAESKMKAAASAIAADSDKFSANPVSKDKKLAKMDAEHAAELAKFTGHQEEMTLVKNSHEQQRADYSKRLAEEELQYKLAASGQFVQGAAALMAVWGRHNRQAAIAARALAIGEVVINTALAVSKVWGQTGIFGIAAQAAPILMGAAQIANINAVKLATGMDQVVRQPTLFMAGEGGVPERVKVSPRGDRGGEGKTVIVVQGDVYDYDRFQRKVKMAQDNNRKAFV